MRAPPRLGGMRARAESLMADTFAIYRPTGWTSGPDGLETLAYESRGTTLGKLQGTSARDTLTRTVTIGGTQRPVIEGGLQLPLGSPLPAAGDHGTGWEYECTAVAANGDPNLVGRRWLVVNAPVKSYATARRLDVVEVP